MYWLISNESVSFHKSGPVILDRKRNEKKSWKCEMLFSHIEHTERQYQELLLMVEQRIIS